MTKNSFGRLKEIYRHNSELAGKGGVGLSTVDSDENHMLGLTDQEHRALVDELVEINSESLRSLADSDNPQFNEYTGDLCKMLFGRFNSAETLQCRAVRGGGGGRRRFVSLPPLRRIPGILYRQRQR